MGRELTKRHSLFFEKKCKSMVTYSDYINMGKFRELVSFVGLGYFIKLGFPKEKYLKFWQW